MTTITLSLATERNGGQFQVFGTYSGDDDRYVFGVEDFSALTDATAYASRLEAEYPGARREIIQPWTGRWAE